jgi:rod shape-determining protein MreD
MKYLKYLLYSLLVIVAVPVQIVLFDRMSIGGVHADLILVVVCLIGFQAGELEAIAVGLILGFTQDLFSGGLHWENLWLKPAIGLLAGLAGRNVMNLTLLFSLAFMLALSIFSGTVMYIVKSVHASGIDFLSAAQNIILPQAVQDAVLGVAILKIIQYWETSPRALTATGYD